MSISPPLDTPPPPARERRRLPGPNGGRLLLALAVAGLVVGLDALTKAIATHYLAGHQPVEILGGFVSFDFYRNFAGPNDILPGHAELISIFAIAASLVLLFAALKVAGNLAAVIVGLLLGGAVGNLIDRIFREPSPLHGGVVDWLRLAHRTNSMNLADLALDLAILLMIGAVAVSWWRERADK